MKNKEMNQLKKYFINEFLNAIKVAQEEKSNRIIILKGEPKELIDYLDPDQLADPETFQGGNIQEEVLKKIFSSSTLIFSYPQFIHLLQYIRPKLIEDRLVMIQDNLRQLYPLSSKQSQQLVANTSDEQIEEKVLHSYQIDPFIVGDKSYYSFPTNSDEIETVNVFSKTKALEQTSNKQLELVDLSEVRNLDVFINECLESGCDNRQIALQTHLKNPLGVQLAHKLSLFNSLLSHAGSELLLLSEEAIPAKTDFKKSTLDLLSRYWGPTANFRSLTVYADPDQGKEVREISQGQIVETIIEESDRAANNQDYKDLFLTAPTGAGKSLLFQLPAFHVAERGDVTIVVSPLIALMKDQVEAIQKDRGFNRVAYLNSDLSLVERTLIIERCRRAEIDVLYLAPELLLSYNINYFIGERKLGLLVIDEAHLITTWGRDFRVDYWFLGNHVNKIRTAQKQRFPMVAVTATAVYGGANDMVFDSIESLAMRTPHIFIGTVKRPDIQFAISNYKSFNRGFVKKKLKQTIDFIEQVYHKTSLKVLVYAPYTKHVQLIISGLKERGLDIAVGYYGSLDGDFKDHYSKQFATGEKRIMVATKAFGMGVDISDIDLVYHHAPSGILPDYIQEVGRVARKKEVQGYAALNYCKDDQYFSKALHGMSALTQYQLVAVLKKLHDLYAQNKHRNMLVSVDDFAHIFEPYELDQKVLTALMMIEKDYLSKYSFNVVVARPKKLFATAYARVKQGEEATLLRKYPDAIQLIDYTRVKDYSFLQIKLDKIWEEHYSRLSFPLLKYMFYNKELFSEEVELLEPQIKINYELCSNKDLVEQEFSKQLNLLSDALASLGTSLMTEEEMISKVNEVYKNEIFSTKVVRFLITNYASSINDADHFHFLRKNADRKSSFGINKTSYSIFNTNYLREVAMLKKKFGELFTSDSSSEERYVTNIPSNMLYYNRVGYFLELFELGTFQTAGGDNPRIFIRINDPERVKRDSLNGRQYKNRLLERTLDKHKVSHRIFDHFFMSNFSDKERWNFIEDYFLGMDVDQLLEDYPQTEDSNTEDIIDLLQSKCNK